MRFDHTAQQLRDTRDLRRALAEARAELEAAGVTVLGQARWWHARDNLRDEHGQPLTEDSHRNCPGHTALEHQQRARDSDGDGYRAVGATTGICADPQAYGHAGHYPGAPAQAGGSSAESDNAAADVEAAAEQARAERRTVIANNRAWRSAETVRRQWLTQFLARKNPPKGALRFLLGEIAGGHWALCQSLGTGSKARRQPARRRRPDRHHRRACHGERPARPGDRHGAGTRRVRGTHQHGNMADPKDCDRRYVAALAEWGNQPSDVEQLITSETGA